MRPSIREGREPSREPSGKLPRFADVPQFRSLLSRVSNAPAGTAPRALRAAVALSIAWLVLLTVAQHLSRLDFWWLELARYVPYPFPLGLAVLALLAGARLGRRWAVAAAATLALVATLGMGLAVGTPDRGDRPLRLMTYNIKAYKAVERADGLAALLREVERHRPDILVVQDHQGAQRARLAGLWPGGRAFGFAHVFAIDQYIVASRYPLLGCVPGGAGFGAVTYAHARCSVDVDGALVSLVTAHFESPRGGLNAARRDGLGGLDEWRDNHADRLGQSRALARDLAGVVRPLIVAGDLNAPQASPVVGALLRAGLRDAFSSAGRGYGYSYGHALRIGLSFLRIDHVLVSPEIGVAGCFVGGAQASDHRPVIADLLLNRAPMK